MRVLAAFAIDAVDVSIVALVRTVANAHDSLLRNDIAAAVIIAVDGSMLVVLESIAVGGKRPRVHDAVFARIEFDLPVASVFDSMRML